jgi:hypothetical protein
LVRRASPTSASVILSMTNGGTSCSRIYSSLATHVFMASSTRALAQSKKRTKALLVFRQILYSSRSSRRAR